jgi:hypothetical protein
MKAFEGYLVATMTTYIVPQTVGAPLSFGDDAVTIFCEPPRSESYVCPTVALGAVAPSLRSESIRHIQDLTTLSDGWDGYNGYAPSKLVCSHAKGLIDVLAAAFPKMPSPEIWPSSNGTVVLSWDTASTEASLEIGDRRFSGYIRKASDFIPLSGEAQYLGAGELSAIEGALS